MTIISDDIGSFPLQSAIEKSKAREIAAKIIRGEASMDEESYFSAVASEIMQKKIDSGIMRPTFPQIQDMITGFISPIQLYYEPNEPWIIRREKALIPEIDAIKELAARFHESIGRVLELRVCVTGPLELYLKAVGPRIEGDLLHNIAESVSRFIENALMSRRHIITSVVSIDEPSLGINPALVAESEDLISAFEAAVKKAKKVDVQVHLHSTNRVDLLYEVEGIKIIGIESAGDPNVLSEVNRCDIESADKFLRVGISRTDIHAIVAESRGEGINDTIAAINSLESDEIILKRLRRAYELFGDRIKYAGPDCGLGSWPNQYSAFLLLRNTAEAVRRFNESLSLNQKP